MKDKSVAKPTAEFPYKKSGQMVGKMGADLEDFQAKQGEQKVDRNWMERVHRRFTESSPGFRAFSLKTLRYGDGEVTVVFDHSFVLFPYIAQYMRKVLFNLIFPRVTYMLLC
jgi:hypothetical protein